MKTSYLPREYYLALIDDGIRSINVSETETATQTENLGKMKKRWWITALLLVAHGR